MKSKRLWIGEIGVDSGMCYIGDPCYIAKTPLGHTADDPNDEHWKAFLRGIASPGKDWMESHATVMGTLKGRGTEFPAGVCVTTGHGDGVYLVYAEFDPDGSIARVIIDFMDRD